MSEPSNMTATYYRGSYHADLEMNTFITWKFSMGRVKNIYV